jgi:hypothetical protein
MVRIFSAVALAALLLGCANQTKLRQAELVQILQWLPGQYNSDALAIAIVPVYAPRLGRHVLYVQEMAANDPRQITLQRLWSIDVTEDDQIVHTVYALAEPARWRNAHVNPDLFKGLQPQDMQRVPGCELLWKKEGERFTASVLSPRCQAAVKELGPDTLIAGDGAVLQRRLDR